ncbi:MAG TPA: 16S rRNA (guanine(966)-N(2))-methyltransferase RsmD [Acidimicrobiales bacterium]|nr:16S rRNA (guanine(966)-N(2))-methyltransferase RsmD [Acidimicrobiales bacterium]
MRVVAGTARGRRLEAPPGRSTRPTGDRVREATFNALHSLGVVEGATVVDLFAGSGALGIEALSRGADHATFVDDDGPALAAVRANLAATDLGDRATVVRATAERWVADQAGAVDLALLDPPYDYDDEAWRVLLAGLAAEMAVLESDREVEPGDGWAVVRAKRYGTTVVTLARHR